jgi:hypothetical protein
VATADPIRRVERLEEAGRATLRAALGTLWMAAAVTAIVIAVFDWQPADVLRGTLLGTLVWGIAWYLLQSRHSVPHGSIMEAPADASATSFSLGAGSAVLAVVLSLPLAWLADHWELGAVFVPGQFCGYAAAELAALVQIRRWENKHHRRVLIDPGAEDSRPYAGPPL